MPSAGRQSWPESIRGAEDCEKFRSHLDWYLDSELPAEGDRDLLEHIGLCEACTRQIDERRSVRGRLQAVVGQVPVPDGLEARIRKGLRLRRLQAPE